MSAGRLVASGLTLRDSGIGPRTRVCRYSDGYAAASWRDTLVAGRRLLVGNAVDATALARSKALSRELA